MSSTILDAALKYAEQGWKVFPLQPNTKIPFPGTNGVKDATDNPETIRAWWNVHPDANVGLACGEPSGVWVVDIDVGHKAGVDGFASLVGKNITLPETVYRTDDKTGSGIRNLFDDANNGLTVLSRADGKLPAARKLTADDAVIRKDALPEPVTEGQAPKTGAVYDTVMEKYCFGTFRERFPDWES